MIEDADDTPDLPPRIEFKQSCPRCHFKHARGKACPRCADTADLDTEWHSAYSTGKKKWQKQGQLTVLLAVLGAMFRRLEGGL